MTEAELQAGIIALCGDLGLLVLEIPDSRRIRHGKGFPDLVIVGRAVLFCECKDDWAALRREQTTWRYRLTAAGAQWRLWRPRDRDAIETELRSIA